LSTDKNADCQYYLRCVTVAKTDRQQNPTRDHPMSDLNRRESTMTYAELDENAQGQAAIYQHLRRKY